MLQAIFRAELPRVPVNGRFRTGAAAAVDACSRFGQLVTVDEGQAAELVQTPGLLRLLLPAGGQTGTGSAPCREWAEAKEAQSKERGPILSPVLKISGDRNPSSGDSESLTRQALTCLSPLSPVSPVQNAMAGS